MANRRRKSIISCYICLLVVYHGFVLCRSSLDENRLLPKAKGTIKTIESPDDGVVIDCVDFWKQPAFDNPITKKLQLMEPTIEDTFQIMNESKLPRMFHKWNKYGECPEGTIPIKRTRSNNGTIINPAKHRKVPNRGDGFLHEYAIARYPVGKYNGASAILNLWNPYVEEGGHEFSVAQIWVVSNFLDPENLNTIEAGWMVNPNSGLEGAGTETTFFTHWTRDNYATSGCRDLSCVGFVQTSRIITHGCALNPTSVYDGDQYELKIEMDRDPQRRQWKLHVNDMYVGYWPFNIFTNLGTEGADEIDWGGEIINDNNDNVHTITEMGSGHFPNQGFYKAAYFRSLMVKDENHNWNIAQRNLLSGHADEPGCYDVALGPEGPDTTFFYGGPGGPNCVD